MGDRLVKWSLLKRAVEALPRCTAHARKAAEWTLQVVEARVRKPLVMVSQPMVAGGPLDTELMRVVSAMLASGMIGPSHWSRCVVEYPPRLGMVVYGAASRMETRLIYKVLRDGYTADDATSDVPLYCRGADGEWRRYSLSGPSEHSACVADLDSVVALPRALPAESACVRFEVTAATWTTLDSLARAQLRDLAGWQKVPGAMVSDVRSGADAQRIRDTLERHSIVATEARA